MTLGMIVRAVSRLGLLFITTATVSAGAVEYAAHAGVDFTDASARTGRVTGRANGRFGLNMDWDIGAGLRLGSGTDYVFRRVTWRRADDTRVSVDFDYVDVPLVLRYPIGAAGAFSVFGGTRAAINVLDKAEMPRPVPSFDPRARAIVLFAEIGIRYDLDVHWAIALAAEREVAGDFAAGLDRYQSYGARGLYRF